MESTWKFCNSVAIAPATWGQEWGERPGQWWLPPLLYSFPQVVSYPASLAQWIFQGDEVAVV